MGQEKGGGGRRKITYILLPWLWYSTCIQKRKIH